MMIGSPALGHLNGIDGARRLAPGAARDAFCVQQADFASRLFQRLLQVHSISISRLLAWLQSQQILAEKFVDQEFGRPVGIVHPVTYHFAFVAPRGKRFC